MSFFRKVVYTLLKSTVRRGIMKLYIQQKVFSLNDKFNVFDENENVVFKCESELLSLGKKLYVYDVNGNELAFIRQELLAFLPKYTIEKNGMEEAIVKKRFTFLEPLYDVVGYGWTVKGDLFGHDYSIYDMADNEIATISKAWLSWGDYYEIDYSDHADPSKVLCVVLIIDAIKAASAAASSASV